VGAVVRFTQEDQQRLRDLVNANAEKYDELTQLKVTMDKMRMMADIQANEKEIVLLVVQAVIRSSLR